MCECRSPLVGAGRGGGRAVVRRCGATGATRELVSPIRACRGFPRSIRCPTSCLNCSAKKSPPACSGRRRRTCKRLVTNALVERNLLYEGAQSFVTPRRLTLHVVGLPARPARSARGAQGPARRRAGCGDPGLSQERGPRRESKMRRSRRDPKKGEFYVAVIEKPGRATQRRARRDHAARSIRSFPWPKSMRWGAALGEARARCAGCARCAGSSARSADTA